LKPGFQTYVIGLATLLVPSVKKLSLYEKKNWHRGRGWEKMAAGWQYKLAVISFVMAAQAFYEAF